MTESSSPKENVDQIIGTSLLVVAFINGGVNLLITKAISQGAVSNSSIEGKVEFASLFLGTFVLSLTMTLAIAVSILPRIFGRKWSWDTTFPISFAIITMGAPLASIPIHYRHSSSHAFMDSLEAFMTYYGNSFYGGEIAGLASGIILGVVAQHYREKGALARRDSGVEGRIMAEATKAGADPKAIAQLKRNALFKDRPPLSWRARAGALIVLILLLTMAAAHELTCASFYGLFKTC